jgi:putative nucleotidyltransferase with HDIG domain
MYNSSVDIKKPVFEKFWAHSMLVARVSLHAAKKIGVSEEEMYIAGLFHDCAIPLFMKKYPDYEEIFNYSLSTATSINEIEIERYKYDHAQIGYIMAKSWRLPNTVCEAIRHHHTPDIYLIENEQVRKILAALMLTECIVCYHTINPCNPQANPISEMIAKKGCVMKVVTKINWEHIFMELKISRDDFYELQDGVYELINE